MNEKRPIDRIRESGGYTDVGSTEDGAIIEMKNIGGRLLIIKERSIYEMVFADKIDPQRTNINLPPTIHKLIIDKGTESETVARTILTAKTLFNSQYILATIDCNKILSLTIDVLSEFSLLEREIREFKEIEKVVAEEYENSGNQKGSFKMPSILNLESRCTTIFLKTNQIEQIFIEIITNFYPNQGLHKQSKFPKFYEVMQKKYGDNDDFVIYINKTLEFMMVLRELRNVRDHRLQTAKISDFELQTDGSIIAPSISLDHRGVKLDRTSLNEFLDLTFMNLIEIIETTFAYLASKNVRTDSLPYQVREIPKTERRHKFVKYSFWSPFGLGGFYHQ